MDDQAPVAGSDDTLAMDPERLKTLKKNLEYLYLETFDLTTLPLEVLFMQVFASAGQRGLPGSGTMLQNGNLMPDRETLHAWIDDYFTRVTAGVQTMAEM